MSLSPTYTNLPSGMYQFIHPEPVSCSTWHLWNDSLANTIGWSSLGVSQDQWLDVLAGKQVSDVLQPLAMAYAGHQFGHFVPQLGDGRALLMAEIVTPDGDRLDVHAKGTGRTMFSRQGDGRCPLGPAIREYIISEAMHGLGIPTTRSLAVMGTGEPVYRERSLPGAVLVRTARAHIRVGTFEFLAVRDRRDELKQWVDYSIQRLYPTIEAGPNAVVQFLEAVCQGQADLVAQWLSVGFIHGVMNTDNMVVSCETIDYGPCAFMDTYHPDTVFSSIDRHGRYAYAQQPMIAQWNISCLANCLAMIVDESQYEPLWEIVQSFDDRFKKVWDRVRCQKIGLPVTAQAMQLSDTFHRVMKEHSLDYTNTVRSLSAHLVSKGEPPSTDPLTNWVSDWKKGVQSSHQSVDEVVEQMNSMNPRVIPRNHRVHRAINAAYQGDWEPCHQLLEALKDPFTEHESWARFQTPPTDDEQIAQTFCGT